MKKTLIIIMSIVAFMSCRRDIDPTIISHEFTEVVADPQFRTCDITCQNESVMRSERVYARLLLSSSGDMDGAEVFPMEESDSCLSCHLTNLSEGTRYYYTFEAYTSVETSRSKDTYQFTTQQSSGLLVTTGEVYDVMQTTAKGIGMVTSEEGVTVTERGLCWGTEHDPSIEGSHLSNGYGEGEYTVSMIDLSAETRYYVRAYATSPTGIEYGAEVIFETNSANLPEVYTGQVTGITSSTAIVQGRVLSEGLSPVTERGVCWSTERNPLVSDSYSPAGSGLGNFSVTMSELAVGTTYYLRAYATNSYGTAYGAQSSFTVAVGLPEVETVSVTDVGPTSAVVHCNVSAEGASSVIERGVCWSTEPSPNIDDTEDSHTASGTGTGAFEVELGGLSYSTSYYVRAYATNAQGTIYGEELSFTTMQEITMPAVTTSAITDITQTTAKGGGNVTSDGGGEVTARGICWSTSHTPTINGSHTTDGTGTGSFISSLTGLVPNTTYYVRAYATNSAGTAYGTEYTFKTLQNVTLPTVTTSAITDITQTTAKGGGNVMGDGGAPVTARGICWSTSHNPTISGDHTSDGTSTGSFSSSLTGLTPNTTYYVRAYATNSAGTAYGDEVNFATLNDEPGDEWSFSFDTGLDGWTTIDVDGDGYNWIMASTLMSGVPGHNGSSDFVLSQSYDNYYGVLYPDNYLVSPLSNIGSGSTFTFWACAQDESYAAEHFGVAVSTSGNSNAADFVVISEWTMISKCNSVTTAHNVKGTRQGNWYQYTVDLSSYAGREVYIAIRHFNSVDQFCLDVDDVVLSNGK